MRTFNSASQPTLAPDSGNDFAWRYQMQRWGAIAYSSTTRKYSCSYGFRYQADAEQRALAECGAPDAFIVVSASDHIYLAFAIAGDGSWAWGADANQNSAQQRALSNCAGAGCHIVALMHPVNGIIYLQR